MSALDAGAAPLLPEMLSLNAGVDSVLIQARVPAQLLYLAGHFTGFPVVAGVVQLAWAQHYARSQFQLRGGIRRLEQLKFQRLLRPPELFTLSVNLQPTRLLITYRIFYGERHYSSGRIQFDPPAV